MKSIPSSVAKKFSTTLAQLYVSPSSVDLDAKLRKAIETLCPLSESVEREAFYVQLRASSFPSRSYETSDKVCIPFLLELLVPHLRRCRAKTLGESEGTLASTRSTVKVLTKRENEVLQRIALGETDTQIGASLGISKMTASKHVEHILLKLGVENRTAAVVHIHSP